MKKAILLWALGAASGMALTAEASEALHIERQITLSPGHRVTPYNITRASNGDLIVLGSTDSVMNFRAWATRLAPSGDVRWDFIEGGPDGWNDHSVSGQRFYNAIELPEGTTLLCGNKVINKTRTVMLVRLDKAGKLLSEGLLPPVRDNAVVTLLSCHKRSDGIVLMGSVSGQPAGTGWMAKLDWDLNLQWKKFSDDFGGGEFIVTGDTLTALGGSWHDPKYYVEKIGPEGDIIAKHPLPEGEHHLVQGSETNRPVRIVTMISNKQTEVFDFDDHLRGPSHQLSLRNVGVKRSLGLPDGSILIIGAANSSVFAAYPSAAVTRVYRDGRYDTFMVEPLHQSPWYIDAVLTGNSNEIAAVRQVGVEQGTLDFLSFK
jgi:hypothetical protein